MFGESNTGKPNGFTLVEIAIVVVIIGLAGSAIINAYATLSAKSQKSLTAVHLEIVQDALGAYVERNFRLPCPMRANYAAAAAEPYGYEAGSGVNGGNIPANCPVLEGLVPFKTLGIDQSMIKDGFGFALTYRVGRSTSRDPRIPVNVHSNCRGTIWTETLQDGTTQNINPELARFCCRIDEAGANELDIQFRPAVAAGLEQMYPWDVDGTAGNYANADTLLATYPSRLAAENTLRPVYVLLSHGPKGSGSYDLEGNGNIYDAFFGTDEGINRTAASSQYIVREWALQDGNANYYDDIVVYGTQETLLARNGIYSCHAPRR
jgi:prepilin-type N-terminal cleavage/methylation domain-containing protein